MKIKPEQLKMHLTASLARVYLVYGDEPLLIDESRQAISEAAKQQGYDEFRRLTLESAAQWEELARELQAYSMFGQQRFFEVALPSGKPGTAGSQMLCRYVENPNPKDTVLIFCGPLESASQKSVWFKTIEAAGVVVVHWPIERRELSPWLTQRLRAQGLQADRPGIAWLVDHVDGNLLAAQQEVTKLSLLYGPGQLTLAQIQAAIADLSRYSIFDGIDFALQQDIAQLIRALHYLNEEGVEPILVLWHFTRELRQLIEMTSAYAQSKNIEQVIKSARIHYKRQAIVKKQILNPCVSHWYALLGQAAKVDQIIKGQAQGRVWDELSQLYIQLARVDLHLAAK